MLHPSRFLFFFILSIFTHLISLSPQNVPNVLRYLIYNESIFEQKGRNPVWLIDLACTNGIS